MNITLELPKRSKIVVFGNDSYELLDLFNKHSVAYTIYNESSGNINVNPIFILKYIINIILKSRSTKIKQLLYNAYHLTNLEYINPKYIFTQTDNSTLIHWLVKKKLQSKVVAIQNGLRTRYEFGFLKETHINNYEHDIFFSFGQYEKDLYESMNIKVNRYFKLGSFRLGLYMESKKSHSKKYDICLISELSCIPKKNTTTYKLQKKLYDDIDKMNHIIAKYAKEFNKKIIVALREDNEQSQINYYLNIFKDNIEFSNPGKYSSYDSVCKSHITLSFFSTLLLESLALGNKVLSIDVSKSELYFNYPSLIKHNYTDYDSFKIYIEEILSMDIQRYLDKSDTILKYSMNMKNDAYPHHEIMKLVNKV
tara:strand:- start:71 stop:1168 length:1098 start_codon:yes stop_codon:yes gene_type:complete